ncbi:MAG: hypothetical protein JXD18_07160, partial [Anaerolineae bacterium]|nr:hypothetical protein [Anaerolineae bacterium]
LRVTPPHARRAVFVASHTEADHMTPASFTDIGMALAWAGFDVDLIPHGQPVTPADLAGADLVVALPVVDYPSPDGDPTMYDDAGWAPDEIDALEVYVTEGGFLIVTNSARRIKFALYDSNEDWEDMNALAERFGVVYQDDVFNLTRARINREHPLMYRLSTLFMTSHNGIPFTIVEGQELASTDEGIAAALVEVGDAGGRVLALADVGSIGSSGSLDNLVFWQNVIEYVTSP